MKKTRILVLVAALAVFAQGAFALDFGGALDSLTAVSSEDPLFSQSGRLTLRIGSGLGNNAEFLIQGGVELSTGDILVLADLDYAYLEAVLPITGSAVSAMELLVGRFEVTDFTGNLIDHAADGLRLRFVFPVARVETYAVYTGLLQKPVSLLKLSKEDYLDELDAGIAFGPKRIIAGVELDIAELFARQGLTLAAVVQEDLRPLFDPGLPQPGDTDLMPGRGGPLDTQYFGAGLHGSIISSLFYETWFYLGTGRTLGYSEGRYDYAPILAFMTGFGVRYYLEDLNYSRITADFVYASGDSDAGSFVEGSTAGKSTAFIPPASGAFGTVVSPELSNIIRARIAYGVKPLAALTENFDTEIAVVPYFRAAAAPISEAGVDPLSASKYVGTELSLGANYRPFSDLVVSLSGGVFLPNGDIFVTGYDTPRYLVSLTATLDF